MSDKALVHPGIRLDSREKRRGRRSVPVPRGCFDKLARKRKPGLPEEEASDNIEALATWEPWPVGMALLARAFAVQRRDPRSWRDSRIVAAAESSGCARIPSEDLAHGTTYFGIEVENPFVSR
jgi:predicted nucleic acid-binding protein